MAVDQITPNLSLTLQARGNNLNSWGGIVNDNFSYLEDAVSEFEAIVTTGGTTTLTVAQSRSLFLDVTGALASNATIVVPDRRHVFLVKNGTTGNYTLSIQVNGGSSVSIPRNTSAYVYTYGNGTCVVALASLNQAAVAITGGTINGAVIGGTTPAAGTFTALAASSGTIGGNRILTVADEGSGNGLDADTLDGQHAAYFLPAANYTAADILAKLLTVDGSGSGLDADLLDGASASWFADIPSRLGYTPVQQGGGADQGTSKIYIGWRADATLGLKVDLTEFGNTWPMSITGSASYAGSAGHSGTSDYASSAGNSDTVDGLHGSQFMRSDTNASTSGELFVGGAIHAPWLNLNHPWPTIHFVDSNDASVTDLVQDGGAFTIRPGGDWSKRFEVRADGNVFTAGTFEANGIIRAYGDSIYSQSNGGNAHFWLQRSNGTPAGIFYHEVSSGDTITACYNAAGDTWLSSMRLQSNGAVVLRDRVGIGVSPGGVLASGASLAIGDDDTGFKQEGDGVLTAYANNTPRWKIQANTTLMWSDSFVHQGNVNAIYELRAGSGGAAAIDFSSNGYGGDFSWRQVVYVDSGYMEWVNITTGAVMRLQNDGNLWTSMFGHLSSWVPSVANAAAASAAAGKVSLGPEQVLAAHPDFYTAWSSIPSGAVVNRLIVSAGPVYQVVYRMVS